jgi:cytochrome c oxidase assembly factor CtaG
MALHLVFALPITNSGGLFLADWYGAMGRSWGASALGDQRTGGAVALVVTEPATVILTVVVALRSTRPDARLARPARRRGALSR